MHYVRGLDDPRTKNNTKQGVERWYRPSPGKSREPAQIEFRHMGGCIEWEACRYYLLSRGRVARGQIDSWCDS